MQLLEPLMQARLPKVGDPKRRKSIIQDRISGFTNASKRGQVLSFTTPPKPRVPDYLRTFANGTKVDVMQ
jgi:hypothetical protein